MLVTNIIILAFSTIMITIGAAAFYFSSDEVQRKYNPNYEPLNKPDEAYQENQINRH